MPLPLHPRRGQVTPDHSQITHRASYRVPSSNKPANLVKVVLSCAGRAATVCLLSPCPQELNLHQAQTLSLRWHFQLCKIYQMSLSEFGQQIIVNIHLKYHCYKLLLSCGIHMFVKMGSRCSGRPSYLLEPRLLVTCHLGKRPSHWPSTSARLSMHPTLRKQRHMYEAALVPAGQGHPRMVSFPRRDLHSLFVGERPRHLEMYAYI